MTKTGQQSLPLAGARHHEPDHADPSSSRQQQEPEDLHELVQQENQEESPRDGNSKIQQEDENEQKTEPEQDQQLELQQQLDPAVDELQDEQNPAQEPPQFANADDAAMDTAITDLEALLAMELGIHSVGATSDNNQCIGLHDLEPMKSISLELLASQSPHDVVSPWDTSPKANVEILASVGRHPEHLESPREPLGSKILPASSRPQPEYDLSSPITLPATPPSCGGAIKMEAFQLSPPPVKAAFSTSIKPSGPQTSVASKPAATPPKAINSSVSPGKTHQMSHSNPHPRRKGVKKHGGIYSLLLQKQKASFLQKEQQHEAVLVHDDNNLGIGKHSGGSSSSKMSAVGLGSPETPEGCAVEVSDFLNSSSIATPVTKPNKSPVVASNGKLQHGGIYRMLRRNSREKRSPTY